jgi:sulfur relay (sulfurtransferase) DsrF/TusC family protein
LISDKDFRKTVSKNAIDVAKIVDEALSSYDPEDRYVCSDSLIKIGLQFLNFIPREFVDLFIKSMQFKFATDRID